MWRTTAKLSVGQVIAWGLLYYTFATCLPFMRQDLGWSSSRLSLGFAVAILISGLSAPFFGRWADRRGTHSLMVAGAIVGAAGLALWSMATTFAVYMAAWVLIGVSMATTLYELAFATAIRVCAKSYRRSIVTITLAGALASTIFMPIASAMFVHLGWRDGVLILAGFLAVSLIPLNLSLPRDPVEQTEKKETPTEKTILSGAAAQSFWVLGIAFMLASVVAVAMNTYAVSYFIEKGLTAQAAAGIVGTAGVAKLVGRISVSAGEWFSAATLLRGSLFLQAVALLLPVYWPTSISMLLMMLVFGSTSGARTILRPLIIVETFGSGSFATSSGLLSAVATLAKSAAPVGMGIAVAMLGSDQAWMSLAVLAFASGAVLLLLPAGASGR